MIIWLRFMTTTPLLIYLAASRKKWGQISPLSKTSLLGDSLTVNSNKKTAWQ
jgi:hypothetical protein